jgi:hypothetical protein
VSAETGKRRAISRARINAGTARIIEFMKCIRTTRAGFDTPFLARTKLRDFT